MGAVVHTCRMSGICCSSFFIMQVVMKEEEGMAFIYANPCVQGLGPIILWAGSEWV